uniref:NAD-dependent epimerase/dehydratase domain-containing protein n=1 Tax=Oryza glumipatula TaxID=40148 RepID=A0A0E0B4R0_9ORYZ
MASPAPAPAPPRVCVTGGGGFIASWLVKLLLSRGYAVHATLRDPCDPKNAHLERLQDASQAAPANLRLFTADVLDLDTLTHAVQGCDGVFHLATPVPEDKIVDPEAKVIDPAVKGTLNVLKACSVAKVQKVVVMSSNAAVDVNPDWPPNRLKYESCWSDLALCEKNEPTVNISSKFLIYVMKGGPDAMNNKLWHIVDVRDVADALLLLYEKPESSGRYVCSSDHICTRDLVNLLKKMYPNIPDVEHKASLTSQKLMSLGWAPRRLEETLSDSVDCYENAGILKILDGHPCRLPHLFSDLDFDMAGQQEQPEMAPPPPRRRVVCVTGAGGFVGSWLVELLLSRGYAVHATVRDPDDPKNAFLKQLENAPENLQLFEADVLDCGSLTAAFAGCEGVFHLATPVPEEKIKEMMAPTVEGTRNVLEACSAASVQKLVVASSIATVCLNPSWPQDMPKDETSWSDKKLCIENEDWYSVAKIEAEEMALEYGKKNGLHTVEINTSSKVLLYMIKGGDGPHVMNNKFWPMVDVRDVADALLLAYHKAGPSERYLCTLEQMDLKHLLDLMKNMYPNYNYADKMVDVDYKVEVTSEKLKNLGWNPRKREETLADNIEFFEKAGLLDGRPCRLPYFAGLRFQSDQSGKVQPEMPPRRVCVTGAGGFIGSWLVKLLLSRGYFVHGTVRNPDDPKNAFLKQLENATENLQLFKADVLDGGSLTAAFAGCEGVFHPATPVPEEQMKEMMAPAVKGTRNVLEACSAAGVQKLVVVSSIAAVFFNPSWPHDRPKDETSWRNMAAMASPPPTTRVCVTGAGGFIGSWLVKLLLSRGYAVHATLRDPCDPKNAHLKQLDGASEMLSLFKADVLDAGELSAAIAGCEGVFHVASPVPGDKIVDPELEVMAPAVKGTLNVLEVCSSSKKVQKVVVVSSTAAVHYNPNWPPGKPKDESCWSDRKICMEKKEWYSASKVIAEKMALEYAEKKGLNVVTVCPCLVFGPQLQPTVNTSNELLIYITKGGPNVMRNMLLHIVDVRDVAEALILSLGWKPRKLEETLTDSIEYYEKTGILQDAGGRPCPTLHTEVQWWQPEMTPPPPPPRRLVCVTGAGGFIGSWLVKLLLSRGYAVHATVRDPHDPKNAFLKQLENAPENLRLFKADVLDGGSLTAAFAGCEGVFHPATPVPEEKTKEMLDPAVKGTRNVLEACSAAGVQKLVVVSSIGAVCFNPSLPRDRIIDETCWSDKKSCKENENWYCLAKTEAEEMALEYSEKNGLHVITVCPALVLGPLLQTVLLSTSSKVLLYVMKGGPDAIGNTFFPIVDVRDVADALLLVYDKAGPSERYICSQEQMDTKDFLDLMKSMYPNYSYTFKVVDVDTRVGLTSEKLKKLGWKPRKLEETLVDSVESHEKAGLVDDEPCRLPYLYRVPDAQE